MSRITAISKGLDAGEPPPGAGDPAGIRVLLVEDDPNDAELIVRELDRLESAVSWNRVDRLDAFERALDQFVPDIVLLDYQLPGFSGALALERARALHPEIPVVMVTGVLADEAAIELLKSGAKDYVLKSNLVRLVPAVRRALAAEQGIRARKTAERAVAKSELRYRRLFEAAQDGILILDGKTGVIVDANPFVTGRLGYRREELVGRVPWELALFAEVAASQQAFTELVAGGHGRHDNLRLRRKDGSALEVEFVSNAYEVDGALVYQCNIRDISDRRRVERALDESELRFRSLIENASDLISVVGADGRIRYLSPAIRELGGYQPEELLGHDFYELVHPDDLGAARRVMAEIRASRLESLPFELRLRGKDGGFRDCESTARNLLGTPGVDGVVVVTRDITQRKRAEQQLRTTEQRYRDLFGATPDAIMTLEPPSWRFTDANRAALKLFGAKNQAEFLAHSPWDASPERQPDGRASVEVAQELIEAAMRQGSQRFEWTHRRFGGAEFPAEVLLTRVEVNGSPQLYATVRDISERRRAESERAFGAAILAAVQQTSPDGILLVDPQGRIMSYNRRFVEIWAIPPDLIAAGDDAPVLDWVADQVVDRPAFVGRVKQLYALVNEASRDEVPLKDGRILDRHSASVRLPGRDYIGRVWFFRDITESRRTEQALRAAHERLQSATEGAEAGVWEYQVPSQQMTWDSTVRGFYGMRPEDGDPDLNGWLARVHPEDRDWLAERIRVAIGDGADQFDAEFRVPQAEGGLRWIRAFGKIYRGPDGIALRAIGIGLDISEAKRRRAAQEQAEAAVQASEHRFRALIENAADIIGITDAGGRLTYVSPSMQGFGGYTPEESLGHKVLEFVDPASREDFQAKFAELLRQPGAVARGERWYRRKDGQPRLFESVARNLLHDPAVAGIVVNLRDITERHEAEAQLRAISGAAMDAVLLIDNQGRLAFWNAAAERMLGYSEAEALGQDMHALLAPARYQAAFLAGFAGFRDSGQGAMVGRTVELAARRKDGLEVPVELSLAGVLLAGQWNAVGILRDISARRAQERALARVNRALKTLSACNSVVVHSASEEQLLQAMCNAVVQAGGYQLAWIGVAEADPARSVRPLAWAGPAEDYVRELDLSWADNERGRGPVGRCLRGGQPETVRDIESDASMALWRERALRLGCKSLLALPLRGAAGVFGVLAIYAGEPDAFDADELALLTEMAGDLSYGIQALRTQIAHAQGLLRLERGMAGTVQALAGTVEARDPYTAGHQRRVAAIATAIARELGLAEPLVRGLELAAIIHDIGKINVPAEILAKPGKLTAVEFELIKTHAEAGYQILKDIEFPWPVAEMVRQHHERLDGSGYPQGLKAGEMLPEAKILAVADVVEAMSSDRPYRPGKGVEAALEEIRRGRGSLFDPDAVDACLRLFQQRGFEFPV